MTLFPSRYCLTCRDFWMLHFLAPCQRRLVLFFKLSRSGFGPVATVVVKRGTLRVGDVVVMGPTWGKVRALQGDAKGLTKLEQVTPGLSAEVVGKIASDACSAF